MNKWIKQPLESHKPRKINYIIADYISLHQNCDFFHALKYTKRPSWMQSNSLKNPRKSSFHSTFKKWFTRHFVTADLFFLTHSFMSIHIYGCFFVCQSAGLWRTAVRLGSVCYASAQTKPKSKRKWEWFQIHT